MPPRGYDLRVFAPYTRRPDDQHESHPRLRRLRAPAACRCRLRAEDRASARHPLGAAEDRLGQGRPHPRPLWDRSLEDACRSERAAAGRADHLLPRLNAPRGRCQLQGPAPRNRPWESRRNSDALPRPAAAVGGSATRVAFWWRCDSDLPLVPCGFAPISTHPDRGKVDFAVPVQQTSGGCPAAHATSPTRSRNTIRRANRRGQ